MEGKPMSYPLQVGMSVLHKKFGRGSITKIRHSGQAEIIVRFDESAHVTVTFSSVDFDRFLQIIRPVDPDTSSSDSAPPSLDDANKVSLKELERKLAAKPTNKKPPG